jgi:Fe2+ or Zn2+ uptake regulation protein
MLSSNTKDILKIIKSISFLNTSEIIDFAVNKNINAYSVYNSLDLLESEGIIKHNVVKDTWKFITNCESLL